MDKLEEGPDPDDIASWRQVIKNQSLGKIQGRQLVAAAQQIGAFGDPRVINSLMNEISERMMRILRNHIGKNHRCRTVRTRGTSFMLLTGSQEDGPNDQGRPRYPA